MGVINLQTSPSRTYTLRVKSGWFQPLAFLSAVKLRWPSRKARHFDFQHFDLKGAALSWPGCVIDEAGNG